MKYLKNFIISVFISIILMLTLVLFITLLNYYDVISSNVLSVLKIIIPLLCVFISGLFLGTKATKRGYLEGIKISAVFILMLILFNVLLNESLNVKDLIFYLIILFSSVFGSMIGINQKKK